MITAFLIATAVVVYFAVMCGLFVASMDEPLFLAGLSVWLILGLAAVFYMASEEDKQGPCLREETGMQYNPATKTVMPYTHCVERGTWTE